MSYRKYSVEQGAVSDPLAVELEIVSKQIRRKDSIDAALSRLDQLADEYSSEPIAIARISLVVADSQFVLGRYTEAEEYYQSVNSRVSELVDSNRLWFRPALGRILCRLKLLDLQTARSLSAQTAVTAAAKVQSFEEALSNAEQGSVEVFQQPFAEFEIATKIGNAFLGEGNLSDAREWFENAIASSTKAVKARLALARLDLASDNLDSAKLHLESALQNSGFSSQTVAGWSLLVNVRQKLGEELFPQALYDEMLTTARPGVRERSVLALVVVLRQFDSSLWKPLGCVRKGKFRAIV